MMTASVSRMTRASMARMVNSLQVLLPLSLDDQTFSDAGNRATIQAALEALSRSGDELPGRT